MDINFDNNKEYTIEELRALKSKLKMMESRVNNSIIKLETKKLEFVDKFVYCNGRGYMLVEYQSLDKYSENDHQMYFRGLVLNSEMGAGDCYESFLEFSADCEWYIPIELFREQVSCGDFREVTREEFMLEVDETAGKLQQYIKDTVKKLELFNSKK